MTDPTEASERLLEAMTALEDLAHMSTPAQAAEDLDPIVLQAFWREWPHSSVWAGTLWRVLNRDLEQPAAQQSDPELDEVGGTG
ncbi:MAG: hypothetical protein QF796_02215 [Acidimicrobiales bacterium]|nr:hypothetical protein [Acidimicrobiales bacterium]MDP6648934.1 hypothetical protein [Acidimicrobiales bacterium]MDP6761094.1 hypothetical protein [Acidimicrobiales bacterium]